MDSQLVNKINYHIPTEINLKPLLEDLKAKKINYKLNMLVKI
jgi:hypothetical protein